MTNGPNCNNLNTWGSNLHNGDTWGTKIAQLKLGDQNHITIILGGPKLCNWRGTKLAQS